jgi:hypothetical protein
MKNKKYMSETTTADMEGTVEGACSDKRRGE